MVKYVVGICLVIAVLYVIIFFVTCYKIDHFVFNPSMMNKDHVFELPFEFEEIYLPNGNPKAPEIHSIYAPINKEPKKVLLYLHGNSDDLRKWALLMTRFHSYGYDVMMVDYPGFGKTRGSAGEKVLYESADALMKWTNERYRPDQIVVLGRSMGCVPASYIASKHSVERVIIETPFANIGLLLRKLVPFIPVCPGLYKKYPVDQYLKKTQAPIYLIRSGKDDLTVLESSHSLVPLAQKEYLIKGADHRNFVTMKAYDEAIHDIFSK